jgi:hypothetical protein
VFASQLGKTLPRLNVGLVPQTNAANDFEIGQPVFLLPRRAQLPSGAISSFEGGERRGYPADLA